MDEKESEDLDRLYDELNLERVTSIFSDSELHRIRMLEEENTLLKKSLSEMSHGRSRVEIMYKELLIKSTELITQLRQSNELFYDTILKLNVNHPEISGELCELLCLGKATSYVVILPRKDKESK